MATTSAGILGNFAPAMQEPYQIESALVPGVEQGNPFAIGMMGNYNYERQLREGDYAQRLGDQMAFGQQWLKQQQADTALKNMGELAKNNLLPATSSVLQGLIPGLDPTGLQFASNEAAATTQATNQGNVGRFLSGAGQYGVNIPAPQLAAITNIPGATPGLSTPEKAQQINAAGRVAAAQVGAAGRGGPSWQTTLAPDDQGNITVVKGRGLPPAGYGLPIPPAGSGGVGTPPAATVGVNKAAPPPVSYSRVTDPTTLQAAHDAVQAGATTMPAAHKDIVSGYVGNKPNVVTDGKGGLYAVGKSGQPYPLNKRQ